MAVARAAASLDLLGVEREVDAALAIGIDIGSDVGLENIERGSVLGCLGRVLQCGLSVGRVLLGLGKSLLKVGLW